MWEIGEPVFRASVALGVEVGNCYHFLSRKAVDRDLDDVYGIALNGGYFRSAGSKR